MASEWAMKMASREDCSDADGYDAVLISVENLAELLDEAYEKGVREAAEAMRFRLTVDSRVYGLSPIHEALKAAQEATGIKLLDEGEI